MDKNYSFGEIIKKYRNENKLSQAALAEMINTSQNTIVNWENDKSMQSSQTFVQSGNFACF